MEQNSKSIEDNLFDEIIGHIEDILIGMYKEIKIMDMKDSISDKKLFIFRRWISCYSTKIFRWILECFWTYRRK